MESRERGHWQHGHSGPGICIAEWKGANLAGRTCKCQGRSGDFEGQEAFAAGPRLTLGEQLRVALRGGPEGRGGSGAPHPDPRPRRSALTSSQGPQLLPAPRPRAGPEQRLRQSQCTPVPNSNTCHTVYNKVTVPSFIRFPSFKKIK